MLIGEYIHTIDEKNRMSLPVKFRKEMGKKIIIKMITLLIRNGRQRLLNGGC